jgi:hypothetical protein
MQSHPLANHHSQLSFNALPLGFHNQCRDAWIMGVQFHGDGSGQVCAVPWQWFGRRARSHDDDYNNGDIGSDYGRREGDYACGG